MCCNDFPNVGLTCAQEEPQPQLSQENLIINELIRDYLGAHRPASMITGVTKLLTQLCLIHINVINPKVKYK